MDSLFRNYTAVLPIMPQPTPGKVKQKALLHPEREGERGREGEEADAR